jgi:hypothetical protein
MLGIRRGRMMKRAAVTEQWPAFDAPLLQGIAAAFARRRKAIAYHSSLTCTREMSESTSEVIERLNLDLRSDSLRLSVWADGDLWLRLCRRAAGRNAGWAFMDHFYGDAQVVPVEALVGMVERTLALRIGTDPPSERQQLRAIRASIGPYED